MRKGEQTKADIIHRSAALFNQRGYAGASMSDVMAATGLQKGGIYRHFESKDDLALQAFDHSIQLINDHYAQALRGKRHAIERLLAIAQAFVEQERAEIVPGGCPLMNTAIESDDTHPDLKARAQRAMTEWHGTLAHITRRGQQRGEVRPSADPDTVATLFIASMEGGLMMSRLFDQPRYLDDVIAHLKQYVNDSLKA